MFTDRGQIVLAVLAGLTIQAVVVGGSSEGNNSSSGSSSSNNNNNNNNNLRDEPRRAKYFSAFQVIKFSNSACEGGPGGKNGTCYTAEECQQKGGTEGGTCADGFGVCCTVTLSCGQTSSENCTYFESDGIRPGACDAHICPCNSDICQIRLDFETFVIAGPSTATSTVTFTTAGVLVRSGSNAVTAASKCVTDTFSVRGGLGGGPRQPTICGTNTGEHMYIEVGESACTQLFFTFSSIGVHTNIPNRAFSIKATQYSCSFSNLAPQGCTQYFHSSTSGSFQSYNYQGGSGMHLDQQDQTICFRRERNTCRICYYAANPTDFQVSGDMQTTGRNIDSACGSYYSLPTTTTTTFPQEFGYDHLNIPGASTANNANLARSNVCGRNAGLVTMSRGASSTICSTLNPFYVNFRTDAYEQNNEVTFRNSGFTLRYRLDSINCNLE